VPTMNDKPEIHPETIRAARSAKHAARGAKGSAREAEHYAHLAQDTVDEVAEEAKAEVEHREDDRDKVLAEGLVQIQKTMRRVIRWLFIGLILIGLSGAVAYWFSAKETYEICIIRNVRTVEQGKALAKLGKAVEKDGDKNQAAVWHEFEVRASQNQLPPCDKPLFVEEYKPDPNRLPPRNGG
jgi:hypothetical protein